MTRQLAPHGTASAWERHRRAGEDPAQVCPPCAAAKTTATTAAVRRHRERLAQAGYRRCWRCGGVYPAEAGYCKAYAVGHHPGYRPGYPPGWEARKLLGGNG